MADEGTHADGPQAIRQDRPFRFHIAGLDGVRGWAALLMMTLHERSARSA